MFTKCMDTSYHLQECSIELAYINIICYIKDLVLLSYTERRKTSRSFAVVYCLLLPVSETTTHYIDRKTSTDW